MSSVHALGMHPVHIMNHPGPLHSTLHNAQQQIYVPRHSNQLELWLLTVISKGQAEAIDRPTPSNRDAKVATQQGKHN